jgi:RNA-directed DNA polymerase
VLEHGERIDTLQGTPQGAIISPLLANIYLHYVYDLWVQSWRKRHATADMIVVRYADDTIVGFQYVSDANAFLNELRERLAKFGLSLHPEKTRLIAFGRFVASGARRKGCRSPRPSTSSASRISAGRSEGVKGSNSGERRSANVRPRRSSESRQNCGT